MKAGMTTLPLAFLGMLAFFFAVGTSRAGPGTDTDGDGLEDQIDNCIDIINRAQFDVDRDGYGNICDGDLNQDNVVGTPDLVFMRASFGTAVGDAAFDARADLNADNAIGTPDLVLLRSRFGLLPGPSGRACAGVGGLGRPGENCPDDDTTAILTTP